MELFRWGLAALFLFVVTMSLLFAGIAVYEAICGAVSWLVTVGVLLQRSFWIYAGVVVIGDAGYGAHARLSVIALVALLVVSVVWNQFVVKREPSEGHLAHAAIRGHVVVTNTAEEADQRGCDFALRAAFPHSDSPQASTPFSAPRLLTPKQRQNVQGTAGAAVRIRGAIIGGRPHG